MGWITTGEPVQHNCLDLAPRSRKNGDRMMGFGDIWKCDECGKEWKVTGTATSTGEGGTKTFVYYGWEGIGLAFR